MTTTKTRTSHMTLVTAGKTRHRCADCGRGPDYDGEPFHVERDHHEGALTLRCGVCHGVTQARTQRHNDLIAALFGIASAGAWTDLTAPR